MAARRKSPIEPLLRLREDRADQAARALAEAARAREAAERRVLGERAARKKVEQELSQVRTDERAALEAGSLRVADLAQAARWGVEETRRREVMAAREKQASADARARATDEAQSRARVAAAHADVDAAAQLLAKGRAAEQARELAALEEAGEEAFAARRHRR